jgi:hypothetical protein
MACWICSAVAGHSASYGRELRDGGAAPLRGLRTRCGDISPSVLNDRIRVLRDAGILASKPGGG